MEAYTKLLFCWFLKIQDHPTLVFFLEHDECVTNQHNCDENALCFNTVGGHNCVCKPGYTGNGTICKGKLLKTPGLDSLCTAWGALSLLIQIWARALEKTDKLPGLAFRSSPYKIFTDRYKTTLHLAVFTVIWGWCIHSMLWNLK